MIKSIFAAVVFAAGLVAFGVVAMIQNDPMTFTTAKVSRNTLKQSAAAFKSQTTTITLSEIVIKDVGVAKVKRPNVKKHCQTEYRVLNDDPKNFSAVTIRDCYQRAKIDDFSR